MLFAVGIDAPTGVRLNSTHAMIEDSPVYKLDVPEQPLRRAKLTDTTGSKDDQHIHTRILSNFISSSIPASVGQPAHTIVGKLELLLFSTVCAEVVDVE